MKVADLQRHLADLARFLEASGGKSVAGDLIAISEGLTPFATEDLRTFASFLGRADAYCKGGEVPIALPKGRKPAASKASAKASPADVSLVAQETQRLYARASDPSLDGEAISATMRKVRGLSKSGMLTVAETIGLAGLGKKKAEDVARAIEQRIQARRGTSQRVGLIDRPISSTG